MQLDLTRIQGPVARIERTFQPAELDTRDDTFRVVAPMALQLTVEKRDDQYQLRGRVETTLSLDCSRCLEPFDWPVSADFDLRFIPRADERRVEDEDARIEEDDVDTSYYDEPVLDLASVLREQFYLALPMKALCRPDCQGLCPVCGINRNTGTCSCKNEWEDPRLAPLRELRDPGERGDA